MLSKKTVLTIDIRKGHSKLLIEIQGLLICVFEINFLKEEGSNARPPSLDGSIVHIERRT